LIYLLDTNVCIALINGGSVGSSDRIRRRYFQAAGRGPIPATSSIAAHELWYGVAKSGRVAQNANRLATFLGSAVSVLDFGAEDARIAGEIRMELERKGTPIGAYDTLIAGQALRGNLVLVTANTREFARVRGLTVEDWAV
jgi:tRNA(fMet)-specific endonuclease VapC